ncbi:MAG: biotin transporter BioY [Eggerthellaceae bacterium]|nr:biotin transporter BioY [Eggerthellaceae bacterium]
MKSISNPTRDIVFIGLATALITMSAWVTIPFGPVPFTLQTMMLVFIVLLLPQRQSIPAVALYVALGALGLPVFSGMRGGIGILLGTSGGFLYGFILGALAAGAVLALWKESESTPMKLIREVAAGIALVLVSYVCGWLQLMLVAGLSPLQAFMAGIAPFILLDAIKLAVAVGLAHTVRATLPAILSKGNAQDA